MLSTGSYHKIVPSSYGGNLRFRKWLLSRAKADRGYQRALVQMCREDLFFFINAFVWQYNPNHDTRVAPFITWPGQVKAAREILQAIHDRRDVWIEKSREMGASWLCLLIIKWGTDFHDWNKWLLVSRSADAVDRPDDSDCLMWKMDFVHQHLPDWLVDKNPDARRKMGYANQTTKSAITGQASTGKAGVGGRCNAMFVDEFTQIDEDYEVLHRTSDTTKCRIFNFTHLGVSTAAFAMVDSIRRGMSRAKLLQLHWTRHPEKNKGMYRYDPETHKVQFLHYDEETDTIKEGPCTYNFPPDYHFALDGSPTGGPHPGIRSPWYDDQCERKNSSRAIAMDLDINPTGSVDQFFDPIVIHQLKITYGRTADWEGDVLYDQDTGKFIEFIQKAGGPLKLWFNLDVHGNVPKSVYGVGADVSQGTGATPSCLSIANGRTGEKVAEYTNAHIGVLQFAALTVALCSKFCNEDGEGAKLVWEHHGPGVAYGRKVMELGYGHVYRRVAEDKFGKPRSDTVGWAPMGAAKPTLLQDYKNALMRKTYLNYSIPALDECLKFKYGDKGSIEHGGEANRDNPSASRENHGDHVIADALSHKMIKDVMQNQTIKKESEADCRSLAGRRRMREERERHEEAWA